MNGDAQIWDVKNNSFLFVGNPPVWQDSHNRHTMLSCPKEKFTSSSRFVARTALELIPIDEEKGYYRICDATHKAYLYVSKKMEIVTIMFVHSVKRILKMLRLSIR